MSARVFWLAFNCVQRMLHATFGENKNIIYFKVVRLLVKRKQLWIPIEPSNSCTVSKLLFLG